MLDLFTAMTIVNIFLSTPGQEAYGRGLLGTLATSVGLQLCVVVVQNKGQPLLVARDALLVVTGFKAAWDVY